MLCNFDFSLTDDEPLRSALFKNDTFVAGSNTFFNLNILYAFLLISNEILKKYCLKIIKIYFFKDLSIPDRLDDYKNCQII